MMVVAYLIVVTYPEGFDPASGVWTFGTRFSLRPGGTRDSSPAIYRRVAHKYDLRPGGTLEACCHAQKAVDDCIALG